MDKKGKKYFYNGAIHIHSTASDGSGDITTITRAAKEAGLNWVIITDHNYLGTKEGIHNGVYLIQGEEISPKNKNHYLALGLKNTISPDENPQVYIDEVRKQSAFGFAAHPHEALNRKNNYPPIRWENEDIIPDGVEIWNWFSCWADKLNDRNIFALAYSFLFKHSLITNPPVQSINWWDKLNQNYNQIIPAIGGVDAHALEIKKYIIPLKIFPYKILFKTIVNSIILDEPLNEDFEKAKEQIFDALKKGKNFILNNQINKTIPEFFIYNEQKKVYPGENIALDKNTFAEIVLDKQLFMILYRNGKMISYSDNKSAKIKLNTPGKYRVGILKNGKGFAYSNPILVE